MSAVDVNREARLGWFGYLDWGAILASVFAVLGTTLLLVEAITLFRSEDSHAA